MNIDVDDHPPSDIRCLSIGDKVAIIPPCTGVPPVNDNNHLQSDDELMEQSQDNVQPCEAMFPEQNQELDLNTPGHPYWIAEITGLNIQTNQVSLQYYAREEHVSNRKFLKHSTTGDCDFAAILLIVKFTKESLLRIKSFNTLNRILSI